MSFTRPLALLLEDRELVEIGYKALRALSALLGAWPSPAWNAKCALQEQWRNARIEQSGG
jgi:hypothetical protein